MLWGIIGPMPEEIRLVHSQMKEVVTTEICGRAYHRGKIGTAEVVLVSCSVGKVNAAITAQTLIERFQVDRIVNIGIAGATTEELKPGDVLICERAVYHDVDFSVYPRYYPYTVSFDCDPTLIDMAVKACENMEGRTFTYRLGFDGTSDMVITSAAWRQKIIDKIGPASTLEMESAAVGQVAFEHKLPCLFIRSVSDYCDEKARDTMNDNTDLAADNAATVLLEMLKSVES